MTAPTGAEKEIYKANIHNYEVRALVQIDYPTPTALLAENFSDQSIDTSIWAVYRPEGTVVSEDSGGFLKVAIDTTNSPRGVLRPASVWSKPNKIFPTNKSNPFSIEFSVKPVYDSNVDETKTYLATAFRICGIDNNSSVGGSIIGVDFNQLLGTRLMMPDGTVAEDLGMDQSYHVYRLDWDGSNYRIYRDGVLKGTMLGTFGFLTFRGADFISIGVQGITSNINSVWTEINVEYITMLSATGIPETPTTPAWATSPQTISGVRWDYLPSVLSGSVSIDKDNDVDAFEITCANYSSTVNFGSKNLLTGFPIQNRDIKIESRVSDGAGNWTSWKSIFYGTIDDAEYIISESGDIQVRIIGRDKYRRQLQRTFITKSYADFTTSIIAIPNSKTVSEIITDLLTVEANISSSVFTIETAPLIPKVLNFINQDCLSIIQELADDIVWEWFVDHKNSGHLHFQSWVFTGTDTYDFSINDEVIMVNRSIGSLGQVGQIELTFEQTNLDPFFAVYPVNRWPHDAAIIQVPSRIVQTVDNIANQYPLHLNRWRRENRNFGSIEITTVGQDWLEMNIPCTVFDDKYLDLDIYNLPTNDGPLWMIDGWEYEWNESQDFTSRIRLVLQETDLIKTLRAYV